MEIQKHLTNIYNVFIRKMSANDCSGILLNAISDHKAIFYCKDIKHDKTSSKYIETKRCTNENIGKKMKNIRYPEQQC